MSGLGPRIWLVALNSMRYTALFFFLLLFCALGCRRLPNVQGKGDTRVQGVWEQIASADTTSLMGARHDLKFSCDSFYLKLSVDARINYFTDTCTTNGRREEYAKGIYAVKDDTLMLSGTYTKANFKQKISGCYNIGRYRHNFLIIQRADEALIIRDLSNNQTCTLTLKEKINCIPKEL